MARLKPLVRSEGLDALAKQKLNDIHTLVRNGIGHWSPNEFYYAADRLGDLSKDYHPDSYVHAEITVAEERLYKIGNWLERRLLRKVQAANVPSSFAVDVAMDLQRTAELRTRYLERKLTREIFDDKGGIANMD